MDGQVHPDATFSITFDISCGMAEFEIDDIFHQCNGSDGEAFFFAAVVIDTARGIRPEVEHQFVVIKVEQGI
jgi:hypothetical protein